jgi:hypothetical protein
MGLCVYVLLSRRQHCAQLSVHEALWLPVVVLHYIQFVGPWCWHRTVAVVQLTYSTVARRHRVGAGTTTLYTLPPSMWHSVAGSAVAGAHHDARHACERACQSQTVESSLCWLGRGLCSLLCSARVDSWLNDVWRAGTSQRLLNVSQQAVWCS